MKVVLPDETELELPDGATGLDAARAIGPKLAEQAVLVRVDGEPRRTCGCRSPTAQRHPDPDHARHARPGRARTCSATRTAHLLAEAVRRLYPGVKVAIGPPIDGGFYYDFEFPEPIARGRPRARSRTRSGARSPRAATWEREEIERATRRARASTRRASRYKVELVDTAEGDISLYTQGDFTDLCRGPHLQSATPIKAVKLTGLAGAYWRGDEKNTQLTRIYGTAFYSPGRPRRAPRAARAGARARPPPARPAARPLPLRRALARVTALAPEGDGRLERARGPPPPREREPRLRRGEDAAHLRLRALGHLRALGEVPREHVPDRGRGQDLGAQADELPGAHAPVRQPAAQLPGAAGALRGVLDAAPKRARRHAPRAPARPARDAGRRPHLLHPRADRGRDLRLPRLRRLPLRPVRGGGALRALDPARGQARHRRGVGLHRGGAPRRRSSGAGSTSSSARAKARSTGRRSTST